MKRLFALVMLCLVSVCCAPHAPEVASRPKDVTSVRMYREVSLDMHVDTDFAPLGRARIDEACAKWRTISGGRINIRPVFDLDFADSEGLLDHVRANHAMLVGVESTTSPEVQRLDEKLKPSRTMGFTKTSDDGRVRVGIVVDRVSNEELLSTVTHELGHVAGLHDLPDTGSVMSGHSLSGADPIEEFTPEDVALCRAALLCP